jgi:hypothetical protein
MDAKRIPTYLSPLTNLSAAMPADITLCTTCTYLGNSLARGIYDLDFVPYATYTTLSAMGAFLGAKAGHCASKLFLNHLLIYLNRKTKKFL